LVRPKIDVLMAGAGGQGIVLASDIVAEAALRDGYDVKKADTLGMAQRGGSVVSHLRLAERVYAPLIKKGEADLLVAFEKLEAARWAAYLRPGGVAVVNDQAIAPLPVSTGVEEYPSDEQIRCIIEQFTGEVYCVPAYAAAQKLGNPRVLNAFMLGFASHFLPIGEDAWQESIGKLVPARALPLNLLAFAQGREGAKTVRRGA